VYGVISALTLGVVALSAGSTPSVPVAGEVPPGVVEGIERAVAGWEDAAAGDPDGLGEGFVVGGPQWVQLQEDVAEGGGGLDLAVGELRLRRLADDVAVVWTEVEASRPGFRSRSFGWDFEMVREGDRWLVWTVVEAERPSGSPTTLPAATDPAAAVEAPTPARSEGTRIPAASAWAVVITVAATALAGYLAPRLDRGGQR